MLKELQIKTNQQVEFVKITSQVQRLIDENSIHGGICHIFVPHTTAGITINEGADPDVVSDISKELNKIIPFEDNYRHLERNSAAHIKASLMGSSVSVFIQNGKLRLGTWQAIFFCEFDGPRNRRASIQF